MWIKYDIEWYEYNPWGGAESRWARLSSEQKEELWNYIEELYQDCMGEVPTITEINDFIWFADEDDEYYREMLWGKEEE